MGSEIRLHGQLSRDFDNSLSLDHLLRMLVVMLLVLLVLRRLLLYVMTYLVLNILCKIIDVGSDVIHIKATIVSTLHVKLFLVCDRRSNLGYHMIRLTRF